MRDPDYRFILCKSPTPGSDPTQPLERIGELTQAVNRKLNISMNKAGSASFSVPIRDPLSFQIQSIQTCVVVEREKLPLWSGPVWTLNGTSSSGTLEVSCVGWLELLNYREIREDFDYTQNNPDTHLAWTDADIALDVLKRVIAYDTAHAPPIVPGGQTGTFATRVNTWQKNTKVGQILSELSELESGFDYWVDPVTRELNISAWNQAVNRPDVIFGFGKLPENLSELTFTEDAASVRNRIPVWGDAGTQPALAPEVDSSQDVYGIFEETITLTGVSDTSTLLAFSGAETLVRSFPTRFYQIVPFPYVHPDVGPTTIVPRLFQDYNLRDIIRLSISYGFINEERRPIRVYGASITITDSGDEIVDSLTTSDALGQFDDLPKPPGSLFAMRLINDTSNTGGTYAELAV
jgi:hypothetical protein